MITIRRQVVKKKMLSTVIMIVFLLLSFSSCRNVEANRRSMNLNDYMEESLTRRWTVEINCKIFDVLINQTDKSITVQGIVEDWEGKDWVEQYFKLRAPSDYRIDYEITLGY